MGGIYEADEPGCAKSDRVWVLRGHGSREPGAVIGYYLDRIVYVVDLPGRGPRAVEEGRLPFREDGGVYKESLKARFAKQIALMTVELAGYLVQADPVADRPPVWAGGR
jgi:hypothetical protein